MRIKGATNWLEVKHGQYASMQSAMNNERVTFSGTSRNDWLALANNGALQPNCNHIGYNFVPGDGGGFSVRIGIVGNNENDCYGPDSFVGFGAGMMCILELFMMV
jgi:hypothetical protein